MAGELISREALERIIQRAAELQAAERDIGEGLTKDELLTLGQDVGIPTRYLQQALLEEQTRTVVEEGHGTLPWLAGPLRLSAARVVPGERAALLKALGGWMEDEELLQVKRRYADRTSWEPKVGAFASIQRALGSKGKTYALARAAEVAGQVTQLEPGFCHVQLMANVQNLRKARLAGAGALAALATAAVAVGVPGCGLMGSGNAQVAASAGYDTVVRDVSKEIWDRARAGIEKSLAKFVEKGKLPAASRDAALKRLAFTTATADLKGCDIVIEAVTEDLELKNALWRELDKLCGSDTIFASNTSSLTIAAMAAATQRGDRFVGLHFFNPVPLMPLVEVVRTVTTSEETFRRAFAFAKSLGKEPVAAKDNSGFIVNLLLVPYLLDAIRAVERGVASVPDIDKAMQLGCGYPMGPLTLLDFVGLDTTYKIAEIMFTEYREQRYAPPPLLKRMVLAGMNGRKTGKGFYDYSVDPPKVVDLGV